MELGNGGGGVRTHASCFPVFVLPCQICLVSWGILGTDQSSHLLSPCFAGTKKADWGQEPGPGGASGTPSVPTLLPTPYTQVFMGHTLSDPLGNLGWS